MQIFNMKKQPDYIRNFADAKIAVIGGGAVGSSVVEAAVKMGIQNILVDDFDPLEAENLSKSSSLYRYPEDIGRNKAVALAERSNALLGINTVCGIDANITMFGPMAFADYDAILAPLDNYAAKIFLNQIWKQIPEELRPELIFGGTTGENAQSNSLNGDGPCLRCLLAEEWMEQESPLTRTSCTGGPQYRNEDIKSEIVPTTGLASRNAANYMTEQLRCRLLGIKEATNKRIIYNPFPSMEMRVATPLRRSDCPDCRNYHPPRELKCLDKCDVLHLTVEKLFEKLDAQLESEDYEVLLPVIEFAKVTYSGLITDDYCRCCRREMKGIFRHEFRTKYSDLLCDECRNNGNKTSDETWTTKIGTVIYALTKENCGKELQERTLFELGWAVGGYIRVIIRNRACLDIMDDDFRREYTFYCGDDQDVMKRITKLEG